MKSSRRAGAKNTNLRRRWVKVRGLGFRVRGLGFGVRGEDKHIDVAVEVEDEAGIYTRAMEQGTQLHKALQYYTDGGA
jgi:hypothetical protein